MILKLSGREQAFALKFKNLPPDLRAKLAVSPGGDNFLVLDLSQQELNTLAGLAVRARRSTGNAKINRAIMRLMKKVTAAAGIDPDNPQPQPTAAVSPVAQANQTSPPYSSEIIVETARHAIPHWDDMAIKEQMQFISQAFELEGREQAEEIVSILVHDANLSPTEEFGGLSSAQIQVLADNPWDQVTPGVQINAQLSAEDLADVIILNHALGFMTALEEQSAKATVRGNLNRQSVLRLIEKMGLPAYHVDYLFRYKKVLNEDDVWILNEMRILLELAKLITLKNGHFVLTRLGRDLMDPAKRGDLYRQLIVFKFRVFNLGYGDRLPELPSFQDYISFSLYRLSTFPTGQNIDLTEAPSLMLPSVENLIPHFEHLDFRKSYVELRLLTPLEGFGLVRVLSEPSPELGDEYLRVTGFQVTELFPRAVHFDLSV
jgi:hypothetical protein